MALCTLGIVQYSQLGITIFCITYTTCENLDSICYQICKRIMKEKTPSLYKMLCLQMPKKASGLKSFEKLPFFSSKTTLLQSSPLLVTNTRKVFRLNIILE